MCFIYALLHIFLIPSNNIPQNALCLNGIEAANVIKFHLLTLYKKCPHIGRHFFIQINIYLFFWCSGSGRSSFTNRCFSSSSFFLLKLTSHCYRCDWYTRRVHYLHIFCFDIFNTNVFIQF